MPKLNKTIVQKIALIISDILSLTIAFILAVIVSRLYHNNSLNEPWNNFFHIGASKLLGLLVLGVFWYQEQYVKRRPFWEELLQTYRIIILFILINLGLSFVMAKGSLKVLIVGFWVMFALVLPFLRTLTKNTLAKFNFWQRDLYIIGDGDNAINAYRLFVGNKLMGYRLRAFVSLLPNDLAIKKDKLPGLLINQELLVSFINENSDCEIIVALDTIELNKQVRFINFLQHNCLVLSILPEISGLAIYGAQIDHFFGNDQLVLRLNNNLSRKFNVFIKRFFDLICVFLGLIILSPLFIILAVIIKTSSQGKVFYYHKRIGRYGKEFNCIKFRTMYPNSHEMLKEILNNDPNARLEWQKDFKLKDDPRITPVGRWLRKTSLDELPQLFNVLKGEMSLVGPRPIVKDEIERYQDGYYYYQLVLPGVTGLWQVSGRNDTDYFDRVRLDEWYVKNWSLWYDIVILLKTVMVVIKRTGAY